MVKVWPVVVHMETGFSQIQSHVNCEEKKIISESFKMIYKKDGHQNFMA